jgi:hypothetical protein
VNDIIVLSVGLVVSILVIFGIFSSVVLEMHEAKYPDVAPPKSEDHHFSSSATDRV